MERMNAEGPPIHLQPWSELASCRLENASQSKSPEAKSVVIYQKDVTRCSDAPLIDAQAGSGSSGSSLALCRLSLPSGLWKPCCRRQVRGRRR